MGQAQTRVDGRNLEHTFAYDSRGRVTAQVEAARAQFYDAIHAAWEWGFAQRVNRVPVKREEAKTGRNDPSPCGSGKKYKACHGRD